MFKSQETNTAGLLSMLIETRPSNPSLSDCEYSISVHALLSGIQPSFIYKPCYITERLFDLLLSPFFISPYFKKCLSFFVHSLSLSLIHTHFIWLCLHWAVLPLLFPLSEIVWGQLAHVSSSPATACGLEIPPSQHFELHVSWLEKSMYTQILRLSAAKCIIHTYIHPEWILSHYMYRSLYVHTHLLWSLLWTLHRCITFLLTYHNQINYLSCICLTFCVT